MNTEERAAAAERREVIRRDMRDAADVGPGVFFIVDGLLRQADALDAEVSRLEAKNHQMGAALTMLRSLSKHIPYEAQVIIDDALSAQPKEAGQ